MDSIEAHEQAIDDLKIIDNAENYPKAASQMARQRIDRAMSGAKQGTPSAAKSISDVEAERASARRSRDFSKPASEPVDLGKPVERADIPNPRQAANPKGQPTAFSPEAFGTAPAKPTREPREQLDKFDDQTLEEAKQELAAAGEAWGTFERPGRYIHDENFEPGALSNHRPETIVNAVPSARPNIEQQFPWLNNLPKMTEGKLRAALESGKGVEYTRLLNEAGRHIQAAKAQNAPIIEEYADRLEEAAKSAESVDPDLARTLRDIKAGSFSAVSRLRDFIERTLKDADSAAAFDKAISDLSTEELSSSSEESSGRGDHPREANQQAVELGPQSTLPGLEGAVAENKKMAAVELGKKLTEKINEPPKSIESAAGEMETMSPLFRGTGASLQNEMFSPRSASSPQSIVEAAGGVYGGKHDAGYEIKLPTSMTKDLPIAQWMKAHVSITIPEEKLTEENIKRAMQAKAREMSGNK